VSALVLRTLNTILLAATTGDIGIPECQMHSGKAPKTLEEALPECNIRERASGMLLTVKRPSPSVVLTLGGHLMPLAPSTFLSFF
jgi:hypothetical protein